MTRFLRSLADGPVRLAAFALVWLAPLGAALASPPAHEGAHEPPPEGGIKWIGEGFLGGPSEDDGRAGFLIILLNFAILLLVLNKLLFRNLRRSNAEQSDTIRLELERATRARAEAEALVKEYESKLDALEVEVESIRAEAQATAEAEYARIIAEARAAAADIEAAAVRAAEREAARYRTELENEIVDQAVARAEAAIRSSFGTADQRRLVDAWVDEVSSSRLSGRSGGVQQ